MEDFRHGGTRAVISVAEVFRDGAPTVPRVVLEEHYHLSYPQVFSHGGEIWMLPEGGSGGNLVLYRAESFPDRWVRHSILVRDRELFDATLLEHGDRLWLFASERDGYGSASDTLVVYHAPCLEGPWVPHPNNPIRIDRTAARPGSTGLLVACLLLWFFISRYKPDKSAAFLIDALMVAAVITMLFTDSNERLRLHVARLLHALLVINCLIAIVEGQTSWRLFPFVIEDRVQSWDYRATALLGHPLVGALVTGAYAVILMTVRDVRGLSERWRLPIILLCMATMPLLGARTSFAVVYGTAAVVMGLSALHVMRGGRISLNSLVGVLLLVPICVVMIAAMFQLGYFDGFLERFSNDKGSAETRLLLFQLFDNFGLRELLVGFGKSELETSVRILGTR